MQICLQEHNVQGVSSAEALIFGERQRRKTERSFPISSRQVEAARWGCYTDGRCSDFTASQATTAPSRTVLWRRLVHRERIPMMKIIFTLEKKEEFQKI